MSNRGNVWRRSNSGELLEVFAPLDQQAEWRESVAASASAAGALARQLSAGEATGEHRRRFDELCRAGAACSDRLFLFFGVWQEGSRRLVAIDFVQNQGIDELLAFESSLTHQLTSGGEPAAPDRTGVLWDFGVAWLPAASSELAVGSAVVSSTHVAGRVSSLAVLDDLVRLYEAVLGDAARRKREAEALPRSLHTWMYSDTEEHGIPAPRDLPGFLGLKFPLANAAAAGSSSGGSSSSTSRSAQVTSPPPPAGAGEPDAMKLLPQFLKDRLADQRKQREAAAAGLPIPTAPPSAPPSSHYTSRPAPAPTPAAAPVTTTTRLAPPHAARPAVIEKSLSRPLFGDAAAPPAAGTGLIREHIPVSRRAPALVSRETETTPLSQLATVPEIPLAVADADFGLGSFAALATPGDELLSGNQRTSSRWLLYAAGGLILLGGLTAAAWFWKPWESKTVAASPSVETTAGTAAPAPDPKPSAAAAPAPQPPPQSDRARVDTKNAAENKAAADAKAAADLKAAADAKAAEEKAKEEARRKAALNALMGQQQ